MAKTRELPAKYFGMSADFRMNLQLRWDLYFAQKDEDSILAEIHPHDSKLAKLFSFYSFRGDPGNPL